jgi:hypothetical protein
MSTAVAERPRILEVGDENRARTYPFVLVAHQELRGQVDASLPTHRGNHFRGFFPDEKGEPVDVVFCLPVFWTGPIKLASWESWMEYREVADLNPFGLGVHTYLVRVPADRKVYYRDQENTYDFRSLADWTQMPAEEAHWLGYHYGSNRMMAAVSLLEGPLSVEEVLLNGRGDGHWIELTRLFQQSKT